MTSIVSESHFRTKTGLSIKGRSEQFGRKICFVVPVYNEEESLLVLYDRLTLIFDRLKARAELILVDDGSTDSSLAIMMGLSRKDLRVKVIALSRNFGQQIAVSAGLDFADADATVVMDADLQDPPELVFQMLRKWEEGFDMVYAIRQARHHDSLLKRVSARLFYRTVAKLAEVSIPYDVGDFRLLDRRVVEAFRQVRERGRWMKGIFGWVGFRQTGVHFERQARVAGVTKYSYRKLVRLALNGIVAFSSIPLRWALGLGVLVSMGSFLYGFTAIIAKLTGAYAVSGWTSLVVVISFVGGFQLMVLGVLGEYVGRIYEEVKQRPLYVVRELRGFERLEITKEHAELATATQA